MDKYLRPSFFWDIRYKVLGTEIPLDRFSNNKMSDYNYLDTVRGLKAVSYQGNVLRIQRVDTEMEISYCMLEPLRITDNNRLTILFVDDDEFDLVVS